MFCAANGRDGAERQAERIANEVRRPLGFVRRYSASISGALPAFIYPVHRVERGLNKNNRRYECASDKDLSRRYP
jgi:hypothetical protein